MSNWDWNQQGNGENQGGDGSPLPPPPPGSPSGAQQSKQMAGSPVRLGPMTLADILDNAFRLAKGNWQAMATVIVLFTIPWAILEAVSFHQTVGSGASLFSPKRSHGGPGLGLTLLRLVVGFVLGPLGFAALVRIAASSLLGRSIGAKEAVAAVLPMWPKIVAITVMSTLSVLGGLVLCIIPGMLVATLLSAAIPILVVEGASVMDSMGRSWALMKTRLFPYLGTFIVAGLIGMFLWFVAAIVPEVFGVALRDSAPSVAMVLIAVAIILGGTVGVPMSAMVPVLVYFDSRVRNEGFDVQMLASRLGDGQPPGSHQN